MSLSNNHMLIHHYMNKSYVCELSVSTTIVLVEISVLYTHTILNA